MGSLIFAATISLLRTVFLWRPMEFFLGGLLLIGMARRAYLALRAGK